jgi:DnaJ-class molecular chaperone
MYDLSVPNARPGVCSKCRGKGVYGWGAVVNGVCEKQGRCWSCKGTGRQTRSDISRNHAYNRHKVAVIFNG